MKIYDLSDPIGIDAPIYPGNPKVVLTRIKKFTRTNHSNLSGLSLGLHTASHLDAPLHYLKSGMSVDKVELARCMGECRVVDCSAIVLEIGEREMEKIHPKKGEILLLKTKNSSSPRSKRFNRNFIHLNEDAARALVKSKVKAIGIDGPSIRKFRLRPDAVHPMLLKAGILIYEGLRLTDIGPGRYFFFGFPLKIKGGEASPVRAIAIR